MINRLPDFLNSMEGLSVLVIGDTMLDRYTNGVVDRICPEGPVPVVALERHSDYPGGAANVALNAHALGAQTTLLSAAGDDLEGMALCRVLESQGLSVEHLHLVGGRHTLLKNRICAGTQLLMRLDQGTTTDIDSVTEEAIASSVEDLMGAADVVVLSDYGYGILTRGLVEAIRRSRPQFAGVLAIDSKDLPRFAPLAPTVVKPNYREAVGMLFGRQRPEHSRREFISEHSQRILDVTGADIAAVTLDHEGAVICRHGQPPYDTFCRVTSHAYPSGAGDSFLTAFCLALGAGSTASTAAEVASAAGAVVVEKEHTATSSVAELKRYLCGSERTSIDMVDIAVLLRAQRRQGKRVVLTNGCFDILHRGHISYLQQAKALGDILVVGVNSDASIVRLKGAGRPINSLEDRLGVLAGISCIDYLVPFEEDTPHRLIEHVRPDVFVKGGDYTRERLPEASLVEELGGRIEILPFLSARSTTRIIERICQSQTNGDQPKEPQR